MRPRYLIHKDIFTHLGGFEAVGALCTVEPGTARKWTEDPNRSGRDIPIVKLQSVLQAAGKELVNLKLQNLIDELLQEHFLNLCHRRVYLVDLIFDLVDILKNGHRGSV